MPENTHTPPPMTVQSELIKAAEEAWIVLRMFEDNLPLVIRIFGVDVSPFDNKVTLVTNRLREAMEAARVASDE